MPLISKAFSNLITFSRTGGAATYFAANGVLTTAANNEPRFDYDPATFLPRGLLIEEQRTNSIRNNTMQGAVAPSTFPTNWQSVIVAGLTATVIGTGTQNGITYLDVRVNGTPSVSTYYNLVPDILVAGASGQTWTGSFWASLIAGSLSNTNANIEIRESDAAQGFLTNTLTALPITSVLTRYSQARTLTNALTAFVSVRFVWQVTSGLPVDFTLRIGLPQLELGAFATSVIPTTTTALTRNADVASVNTLSPWFNSASGTLYAESFRTTIAAASTFPSYAEFDNGTLNRYGVYNALTAGANEYRSFAQDAGVAQADIGGAASRVAAGTVVKQAAAFAANDFALSVNGSSVFTDTAGTLPSSLNRMSIGSSYIAANFANAWIRRITYYPTRLSNAQLQTITT